MKMVIEQISEALVQIINSSEKMEDHTKYWIGQAYMVA